MDAAFAMFSNGWFVNDFRLFGDGAGDIFRRVLNSLWASFQSTGVKLGKICKGIILVDLGDIWKIFGEILALQKFKEKPIKTQRKIKKNQRQTKKNCCFTIFF